LILISDFGPTVRVVILAALLAAPTLACGQVLEIGPSGVVRTFDGPTLFRGDGDATALRRSPAPRQTPRVRGGAAMLSYSAPPAGRIAPLEAAADSAQLSPALIEAVAWRESRLRPRVISPAGAIGEMQLMPATARALGVDPFDSQQNYAGGAHYLGWLMRRYNGDLVRTLAAYNAGPGAVDRYGGVPPFKETRAYVGAVLDRLGARATLATTTDTWR
jgi:soluble lytic murein transglycosylase-like protein